MQYRITAPESAYDGKVGDLQFSQGRYEGDVPDSVLAYCQGAGYTMEKLADARKADKATSADEAPAEPAPVQLTEIPATEPAPTQNGATQ